MRAPPLTRRVVGENLKLSIVIADDVPDEPPALGAAPALGRLPPPPHPAASTAATATVERRVYARNVMPSTVGPRVCAPIRSAAPLIARRNHSRQAQSQST